MRPDDDRAGAPGGEGEAPARGMEVAPFRALRYDPERFRLAGGAFAAPPYDVISPEEHRRLLESSPWNIARLTLGSIPGGVSSYEERGALLDRWAREGILVEDASPGFYAYAIEYAVPEEGSGRKRFIGLLALGRLYPFEAGIVLPHEKTFERVVEDRYRLLDATRANLEPVLLLYADPRGEIDALLEARSRGAPAAKVEAKPGEFHAVYPFCDPEACGRLRDFFRGQRPIIADGHHRYTTSLKYAASQRASERRVPGADWQLMTFANLYADGVSILGTHRLVKLRRDGAPAASEAPPAGRVREAFASLVSRLERASSGDAHFRIETREGAADVRFPASILEARKGVARTAYALLHDVVLGEWLADALDPDRGVRYFKEGTGEREALERGEGDILFRMKPVGRSEFQAVVEGGEVFPHKTTYFYPKLWSGLVLWRLEGQSGV